MGGYSLTSHYSLVSPNTKTTTLSDAKGKKQDYISTLKEKLADLKKESQSAKRTDFLRVLQWQFVTILCTADRNCRTKHSDN